MRIRLGTPLRPQRYPSGGRMKTVSYWHGRVVGDHSVDGYLVNDEIDEVAWVPVRKARKQLSYTFDQHTLEEALSTEWRTRALVVLRHTRPARGSRGARTTGCGRCSPRASATPRGSSRCSRPTRPADW